jgi:hypothetical protein
MSSYMFRSVRTIFRELMPDLAKVTICVELSVKYTFKIVAVLWQHVLPSVQQCVYWVLCGV